MSDGDHSSLSSSLTDLMTSLMVIFILLLVNYLGDRQDEIQIARSKTDEMRDRLTVKLKESLVEGVEVTKLDNYNLVVIVPDDKLQFAVGRDELSAASREFLGKFVPALLDTYLVFEHDVSLINVEGHSDSVLNSSAINKYYNWDLSQKRASAVMTYIFDQRSGSKETEKFKNIALFGGRGPIECKYTAQDEEALRKTCRTVKFKIRMRSSEESAA